MQDCFHCGEPVPQSLSLSVMINGRPEPMCCAGCQAVAETIIAYGLENFYRYRTGPSRKPTDLVPEELLKFEVYDDVQFQEGFTESVGGNRRSAHLVLEDIVCPACTWLIESRLRRLPGLAEVKVNYASNRADITWQEGKTTLGTILKIIQDLGYRAYPYDPRRGMQTLEAERKSQLRRLGLAGLLGMQVMMLSIAIYTGDWSGMESEYKYFFYWICLLLTTPVMFYSARPFFTRAWRDLRVLHTGMDVPVSLGLAIAYLSSIWTTVTGVGQVYYDSVVMFIFLLLTARYFEFLARKRAMQHFDEVSRIIPAIATRLEYRDGQYRQVPVAVAKLQPGDRLLVKPGETISADGVIVSGTTAVDESLITGESMPVRKSTGEQVIGGSTNVDSPIEIGITRIGKQTILASILKLADTGRQEKAAITRLSNRIASWFVLIVLILAVVVAVYWWHADRSMWIPVTISLLVITCPCALSLAIPVAVTSATTRLMSKGLVIINNNALEILNRASHFIFDKTGTLTEGRLKVYDIVLHTNNIKDECLAVAAALECNSEHPVARAILDYCSGIQAPFAERVVNHPGRGIEGLISGRHYYLGTAEFIQDLAGIAVDPEFQDEADKTTSIILADRERIYCCFRLSDRIRSGAGQLITDLARTRREIVLLSGDSPGVVRRVAEGLGIQQYYGRMSPEQKLAKVEQLAENNNITAVIGDGINDAPILARAHISIAMGAGVDVAKLYGDMILLNSNLLVLNDAVIQAARTAGIIRQNIAWAVGYNLLAIPVAVTGLVAPWEAAIGMSLSSLIVVGNSMRLSRS